MKFTKMQGCGNDYIYINGFQERIELSKKPDLVRKLSHRHFGIGGDGVIFINPSREADFEMEMYNADGTRAEMCGNGIRCVGKYVYDYGLTDSEQVSVISAGRKKLLELTVERESDDPDDRGTVKQVRVPHHLRIHGQSPRCDFYHECCRDGPGTHRAAVRTSFQIPQTRQYGIRGGNRSQNLLYACMGEGNRGNPGLRDRLLRGGCSRGLK